MSGADTEGRWDAAGLVQALRAALGPTGVLTGGDTAPYASDWRGLLHGAPACVARPRSTAEVASVVRIAAAHGASIVPQGGNTGLSGGAAPDGSGRQIVLALGRMTAIRALDPTGMTLTVEAGATLAAVQAAAAAAGLLLPLAIGSQGTAQIGGIVSTNAGGNHTLRHGNTREWVLGLEVVLADGRVWDGLRALRKDNSGYALKHLFIGAEGTLGIVTAAVLRLVPAHRAREVAWASLVSVDAGLALLRRLQAADADALFAYEYMSAAAIDIALAELPGTRLPVAGAAHYVLIELATARPEADLRATLEAVLGDAAEAGEVPDAAFAENEAQRAAMWRLREEQGEAQRRAGASLKNDVSVPLAALPTFLTRATDAARAVLPTARVAPYGHLGDGNIHFNVVAPAGWEGAAFAGPARAIEAAVMDVVRDLGGSFSAEHGIGRLKTHLLAEWHAGPTLDLMRAIRAALDPGSLFGEMRLLPTENESHSQFFLAPDARRAQNDAYGP